MTNLSKYFRFVRARDHVPLSTLAKILGYSNLSKGANKITRFEQTGEIDPRLLLPLATALGISTDILRELKARDRQARERWADEPVEPHLVIRLMPSICGRKDLPKGISRERAERVASVTARRSKMKVALIWNRRTTITFDEKGIRHTEDE
jgi:hypothetical protein